MGFIGTIIKLAHGFIPLLFCLYVRCKHSPGVTGRSLSPRGRAVVMIDWSNVTASGYQELGPKPEELQKSKCVLGFIPVIYYSVLLCVGVPGTQSQLAHHSTVSIDV